MQEQSFRLPLALIKHFKSNMGTNLLLLILLFLFVVLASAKADEKSDQIIVELRANLEDLKTFTADIKVDIDISFVDIPAKSGKMYYKAPNKTKIDIPGFSMLPKEGVGNFVGQIIDAEDVTAIYAGVQEIDRKKHHLIKVLPIAAASDIVLTSLWVDSKTNTVTKAETTTKNSGSFNIDFRYSKIDGIYLPNWVRISFDVPEFELPKTMTGDTGRNNTEQDSESIDGARGSATIVYSNIEVNVPISDSVFSP